MSEGHPKRGNVAILSVCQALAMAAGSIDMTLTALTGYQLAPDKLLATLPFSLITVAGAFVTFSASMLMKRIGRKLGFMLGATVGTLGGIVSFWAVLHADFWVFCMGTAAVGVFQAFAQYYRLAASDSVRDEDKSKAISAVLAGGVVAAVLGPMLASWSKDFIPTVLFAGSYLAIAALSLVSILLLAIFYRELAGQQASAAASVQGVDRSIGVIVRTPIFMASTASMIVGSVVMMFVMTAAPLAAVACGHTIDDGANIIQWHLVGMFAPSFVTGILIKRFGLPRIVFAGIALNLACTTVAVSSISLAAFYLALFCLGVGWNFLFVAGSTLLAQSCRPSEQAKTQGTAELARYLATAIATLAAGPILEIEGWKIVNLAMLPLSVLISGVIVWWVASERRRQRHDRKIAKAAAM
ncbi:MAG TPA: MFS transporter [Reyranella sp.]|jgi:MFS family permease|nr:MFS transporter [Reyranella sp.]